MATKENKAFLVGLTVFVLLAVFLNVLNISLIPSVSIGAAAGVSTGLWLYRK